MAGIVREEVLDLLVSSEVLKSKANIVGTSILQEEGKDGCKFQVLGATL